MYEAVENAGYSAAQPSVAIGLSDITYATYTETNERVTQRCAGYHYGHG
jgi:hypothetical protein